MPVLQLDYTLSSSRGTITNSRLITCGKFCHLEFYLTLSANAPAQTTIVSLNKYLPNTRAMFSVLQVSGGAVNDVGKFQMVSSGGILTTQAGYTSGTILILSGNYSMK